MKHVSFEGPRTQTVGPIIENNGFAYAVDFDWFKGPEAILGIHTANGASDSDGILFVATDDPDNPVILVDPEGNYIKTIGRGLFKKAHSTHLTPQGTLLVADTKPGQNVIREITKDGELVRDFGVLGQAGDSGYDSKYLAVLEAAGKKPTETPWNKDPEKNARLDSIVRIGKPFVRPCSMAMTSLGEYYAADGYGNCAVHKFDPDGQYAFSWGGPGLEPGHFRLVHDIKVDRYDRIWVADRENARVQVFDRAGTLLALIDGNLMRIGSIAMDHDHVYIGELDGGFTIVSMDFEPLAQFGYKGSPLHDHGIAVNGNGDLVLFTNKKNPKNIVYLSRRK